MKSLKRTLTALLIIAYGSVVGIFLLVNPTVFTVTVIFLSNSILLLNGIVSVIRYFRMDAANAVAGQGIFVGLACIMGGVLGGVYAEQLIQISPHLASLYGVFLFLIAFLKLQWTFDMLRLKRKRWRISAVSAVIAFLCAGITLLNPFVSVQILWKFIAGALLAESVLGSAVLILSVILKE